MNWHELWRTLWTAAVLIAILAIIVLVSDEASAGRQRVVTSGLIYLIAVIGLFVFTGNSGVMSFGHIGFMGIGAYVAAWLTIPSSVKASLLPGLPEWLVATTLDPSVSTALGGLAAAAVALLFGLPLMRMNGVTASIGTFAMLAILQSIFANWTSVTGGQGSLYGLPTYTTLRTAAVWAVVALVTASLYQASPWSFRLRGSREDPVAAAACGVNIQRERLIAFVLSAVFCGIAGALYAYFLTVVVADQFFLELTFMTVAMLVIGGMQTLTGAFVGVGFVLVLSELLRNAERGFEIAGFVVPARPGLQEVVLALAMLAALVFRPQGLAGRRDIPIPQLRLRRRMFSKGRNTQ